jgi:NAD(P)-dependent dehydrogenase (short-subunit alcohol dehydrogenase family)
VSVSSQASLHGKTALVVGASSGIGRATACAFASAGASVAVASRRLAELEQLAVELRRFDVRAHAVAFDTRHRASVEVGLADVEQELGTPDIVVYAAGANVKRRALDVLSAEDWSDLLATNLTGAFHVTQALLPALRRNNGGLIIYVSSAGAKKPDHSGVAYQASKHGMVGLAHGTMEEERRHGIRTSVVFPGLTDTPLVLQRPAPPPPDVLARALQPEDVAAACLFIAQLPPRAHVPELLLYPSQP